ncbi:hypothetical protein, partial [Enterococcus faecium]|uniref:hypothetical protein n=1 Tax=Enterococcus faecium TaxID=1352 RepID=UPI003F4233FD
DDPGLYMFEGRPHWHRYSGLDGDMDPDLSWEEATIRPAAYHEMPAMLEAHQKLKERLEKEEQEVQARADAMEKELQTELDLAEKE